MKEGTKRLISDLANVFLNNKRPAINDVTLISADGKEFPSSKCLLAARAPFFERLLFQTPPSSSSGECVFHVEMPERLLKYVLQYLITGDIELFNLSNIDLAMVNELIKLVHASDVINCDAMYADCVDRLLQVTADYPAFTCYVLENVCRRPSGSNRNHDVFIQGLVKIIRKEPVQSMRVSHCTFRTRLYGDEYTNNLAKHLHDTQRRDAGDFKHCCNIDMAKQINLQNDELDEMGVTNLNQFGAQFLSFQSILKLLNSVSSLSELFDDEYCVLIIHHWIYKHNCFYNDVHEQNDNTRLQNIKEEDEEHVEQDPLNDDHLQQQTHTQTSSQSQSLQFEEGQDKDINSNSNNIKENASTAQGKKQQQQQNHSVSDVSLESNRGQNQSNRQHLQSSSLTSSIAAAQTTQLDRNTDMIDRIQKGRELMQLIDLKKLRPEFLQIIVEPMKLLSVDKFCSAYRYHAVESKKQQQANQNRFICSCFLPSAIETRRSAEAPRPLRVIKKRRRL